MHVATNPGLFPSGVDQTQIEYWTQNYEVKSSAAYFGMLIVTSAGWLNNKLAHWTQPLNKLMTTVSMVQLLPPCGQKNHCSFNFHISRPVATLPDTFPYSHPLKAANWLTGHCLFGSCIFCPIYKIDKVQNELISLLWVIFPTMQRCSLLPSI